MEKAKELLKLIKQQDDCDQSITDKINLYYDDSNEAKHQYLIKKCKKWPLKFERSKGAY